ncbi:MAG: hypothetical protein ACFWTN_08475 [Clostridium sp.]
MTFLYLYEIANFIVLYPPAAMTECKKNVAVYKIPI